ncbi:MAG: DNA topoisomerase IV subunit A, partial [Bacilli bacterium]|nr:DNA topoisomerase IV subunit A [Bacilli bacterium]
MARKKEEKEAIVENIFGQPLDDLMGEKFKIYAKDVILDRAIPDARDGLKPVQRRILFCMFDKGYTIDKPTKKCAHIVGDVMGNYHPHGDSSIYEALVHMSQKWVSNMPLIDFQGNNGSIDGDGPAAYRYTEARLAALAGELLRDIDKQTVDMALNFDDSLEEPVVLPGRFPNLLVNGADGIAVGIATAIPPHNLKEVIGAVIHRIKYPECNLETLLNYVKGPDFPTGGIIYANESLKDIYLKGKGKVTIGSRTEIVTEKNLTQIIISEIPYRIKKTALVKEIDQIRFDKTIPGIDEVRDESDKEGTRIVIDLKNDAKADAVLGFLLKKTSLMTSYSANMVAIVDGHPKTMDLISYLDCYIQHQLDVVTRRCNYLLEKYKSRLEIVQGLIKAISVLDEVVAIIRASHDKADSKKNLMNRFHFNEPQVEAIVTMPLYKLSNTDVQVLVEEEKKLTEDMKELKTILSDQSKKDEFIINDLRDVAKRFGIDRRTEIKDEEEAVSQVDIDKRDLIAVEDTYVVATRDGYIKRSSVKSWRGSGGQNGVLPGLKEGDAFVYNTLLRTTDIILAFTNKGNFLYIPVNEIKETKWNEEGFHVSSLVPIQPGERLIHLFGVRKFRDDLYIVLLSKLGSIKRCVLSSFQVVRRSKPVCAMKLTPSDEIVGVTLTSGNSDLLVCSSEGKGSFYNENEVPITNPRTGGVKAGKFHGKDLATILSFLPEERDKVLLITDKGCTRIFDISRLDRIKRTQKSSVLFNSFLKEPHKLVFASKTKGKDLPYTFRGYLTNGENKEFLFEDFYVTPMEKYAKKPD